MQQYHSHLISWIPTLCSTRTSLLLSITIPQKLFCFQSMITFKPPAIKPALVSACSTYLQLSILSVILLDRLSHWFRFRDTDLAWVTSYLHSRTFSDSPNTSVSGAFKVSYGVPQGTLLGPLVFLLYSTPMSHLVRANDINHHLFADDNQLYSFSVYFIQTWKLQWSHVCTLKCL